MKRKLVQHGEATMMISLPAKWIKKNNLEKGEELDIQEQENKVIVEINAQKKKSENIINVSSLEESSIRTLLANSYRAGFDKLKVIYKGEETFQAIQKAVEKNLLGFEITKVRDNECEIESVTEPSKDQYENIFSKIWGNIEELFFLSKEAFSNKKPKFEDVERRVLQYDNFCRRVIVKNNLFDNGVLRWSLHSNLVHGAREIYHLLVYCTKNKIKFTNVEIDMLSNTKKIFELIKEAYEKKDIVLLEKLHELEKDITYSKGYKALNNSKNPVIIHHLMNAIRNFYLSNSPLMGIIFEEKKIVNS